MSDQREFSTNLYLLGMPGSGKSTLGKEVAMALGVPFHDLDAAIESEAGMNINQIFDQVGEAGFRGIEEKVLKQLTSRPEAKVLALGGGTPCFYQNMEYINQHGVSVFLNVPLEVIVDRLLAQGTESRPLLKNKSPQELLGQLQEHFLERKSFYLKALVHLEGSTITSEQILDELHPD